MVEFQNHKILFTLQPDLNIYVAGWVDRLVEQWIYDDAYDLYEDLRKTIIGFLAGDYRCRVSVYHDDMPGAFPSSDRVILTEEQVQRLRVWLDNTPIKDIVAALNDRGGWGKGSRTPPKATPEQIRIIEEAQKEVGLDFTRFFSEFTTWEADAVIKGCVTVSEVQRQTGDRHFALKYLRNAIRNYILNPPPTYIRGREKLRES